MTKRIRIVSNGTAEGTTIMVDGKPLDCVTRLEVLPIEPGQPVVAVLTVLGPELDIEAEAVRLDTELKPSALGPALPRPDPLAW